MSQPSLELNQFEHLAYEMRISSKAQLLRENKDDFAQSQPQSSRVALIGLWSTARYPVQSFESQVEFLKKNDTTVKNIFNQVAAKPNEF